MGEFKELRNEISDNPAGFDQMKAQALELLRDTGAYLLMAKQDNGLHCLAAVEPGVNSDEFMLGIMQGMTEILERMEDLSEEARRLDDGQEA